MGEFLALSKEKFHLRTNHSILLGYWTSELGGLNQVVHLWEYGEWFSTSVIMVSGSPSLGVWCVVLYLWEYGECSLSLGVW